MMEQIAAHQLRNLHKLMYVGLIGYIAFPFLIAYFFVIYKLTKLKQAKLSERLKEVVSQELTTAIIAILNYFVVFFLMIFARDDLLLNGLGILFYFGGFLFVLHRTLTTGKLIKKDIKKSV